MNIQSPNNFQNTSFGNFTFSPATINSSLNTANIIPSLNEAYEQPVQDTANVEEQYFDKNMIVEDDGISNDSQQSNYVEIDPNIVSNENFGKLVHNQNLLIAEVSNLGKQLNKKMDQALSGAAAMKLMFEKFSEEHTPTNYAQLKPTGILRDLIFTEDDPLLKTTDDVKQFEEKLGKPEYMDDMVSNIC